MMTARENDFESRLRLVESEVESEKALTRHLFTAASGNGEEIAAIRIAIAALQRQAERAAGNIELVKTMQVSEGMMLNIVTQDMREIGKEIGQMQGQMDEMRMETGETCTEIGDICTQVGETRARLDAMERNIDARFDAIERKFDVVLAAIRTIAPHSPAPHSPAPHSPAPHAPPTARAAAARTISRRSRPRGGAGAASTPRRPRDADAA